MKDLGRCRLEAVLLGNALFMYCENTYNLIILFSCGYICTHTCTDLEPIYGEIKYALKHLKTWMRAVPVEMPVAVAPAVCEYVYEPYGVCLVMGAFNYPIQLTVG